MEEAAKRAMEEAARVAVRVLVRRGAGAAEGSAAVV